MRKHGRHARRQARSIQIQVEKQIVLAMWSARVKREAESGARIVAGPIGEVMKVVKVAPYDIVVEPCLFTLMPYFRQRLGARWTERELKDIQDAVTTGRAELIR